MPTNVPYTNFSSIAVNGVPTQGIAGAPLYTGNWFFVNETTGSDGNVGSADAPFKTLTQALSQCIANNNDVVAFIGTIHLTSTLVWAKSQVHLIGMDAPLAVGQRARISTSGSTAFTPLVSVTASGCHFRNFGTFYAFNSASNNSNCWEDTGGRSCYENINFLGFGDGTASTGTANITTARAFKFNTNNGESTWRNCYFGADTEVRNATNYTLEIAGNAPRLVFENCDFAADLGSSGTAGSHVLIGSAGIDRWVRFVGCRFTSFNGGSTMAQAFNLSGSAGGSILLDQCTTFGAITAIETSATGDLYINMSIPSTSGGKAIATV